MRHLKSDAIRALVDSAGSIDMLVMHDRVITLRPFPPDVEVAQEVEAEDGDSRGEAGPEGGGQEEEYDDRDEDGDYILNDEGWEEGLRPFQARPFMSEVLERNGENVSTWYVLPVSSRAGVEVVPAMQMCMVNKQVYRCTSTALPHVSFTRKLDVMVLREQPEEVIERLPQLETRHLVPAPGADLTCNIPVPRNFLP